VQLLGNWLSEVREKKFRVETEFLKNDEVHLDGNNAIARCLTTGGVVLLRLAATGRGFHFVLTLYSKDGWLYCFDPYPGQRNKKGAFEWLKLPKLHAPNLRIRYAWAKEERHQRHGLGELVDREALLMWRG
jgi:hypothetical protein